VTETVVALGASNLTRGFGTVVSAASTVWGPDVHVIAALGHGRSYGTDSWFLARRLPGILDSGLWRHLDTASPGSTRAFITDVGNDIAYGFPPDQVLAWIDEAIHRLQRVTADITLTDLPMASIRRLSVPKYLVYRSIVLPSCRLSLDDVLERAERVNAGLEALAASRQVKFFRLSPDWYGFDPIHIRPALWQRAWRQILGVAEHRERIASPFLERWRLYVMAPERQAFFGVERVTAQSGVRMPSGARVWLF
jgi:hypothetical protein